MLHEVNLPVYYTIYSVQHYTMQLESMVDYIKPHARIHKSLPGGPGLTVRKQL